MLMHLWADTRRFVLDTVRQRQDTIREETGRNAWSHKAGTGLVGVSGI